jgi:hypothetical protein
MAIPQTLDGDRAGGPSISLLRISPRITISVLPEDRGTGVAKTVPPFSWFSK